MSLPLVIAKNTSIGIAINKKIHFIKNSNRSILEINYRI